MQRHPGRRGQVGVDGGGGDAGVAEQDLHDTDVDTVLDQPCRVGVAQAMRGYPALDTGRGNGGSEGIGQHTLVDRRITVSIGEQPAGVVMGLPEAAQRVEHRLRQRRQPLLVALADDAQHVVGPVNGANFQRGGLADAQAARIHNGETRLVNRVADAAEQEPNLIVRQRVRQPLLPWRSDPFFPRTAPRHGRAYGDRGSVGRTGWSGRCRVPPLAGAG